MIAAEETITESSERIRRHFAQGEAWGVIRLAVVELGARLSPLLVALRALGCAYFERLCAGRRFHARPRFEPRPDLAALTGLPEAEARRLWDAVGATLELELRERRENAARWIERAAPNWADVGRVFFHLSERPDAERPFRFFASCGVRDGPSPRVRIVPLRRAVRSAGRSAAMLGLTAPIFWAAERSWFVHDLLDRGRVYDTLDWTPDEALDFVEAIPILERAGIAVRAPAVRPRATPEEPEVRLRIGERPSVLTTGALLDFSIEVALGGETLGAAELRAILAATSRLVSIRGRWIAVDRDALAARVQRYRDVTAVPVGEALRLLAGVSDEVGPKRDPGEAWFGPPAEPVAPPPIVLGAGLRAALDGLARPDPRAADPGPALATELRGYQKVGVAWLWQLQALGVGGCLADDMGLGKTVQVLALLLVMKERGLGPTLLAAPASLVANWRAEAARFAPGLRVHVAHSSERRAAGNAPLDRADLVVTSYGSLGRQATLAARRWRLVVLDEAQAIKNPSARLTRTVKRLASETRLALTGTPVENGLEDLWSIFDFVNPGLLGDRREFAALCERLAGRQGVAPDARYEPLRRLVRPYVLRRCKTDRTLIPELPDKSEVKAWCALTRTQAALYQQTVDKLARDLEQAKGMARRGLILAALVRLKQICNHPSQWLQDGVYDPAASGKMTRVREICERIVAAGEKVLVFTQFREMTEPLAAFLATIFGRAGLVLSGETEVAERRALVERFQDPAGPPFFVLSLRAGGTGLTLTAASHVIHFDRWWNPAVENQATDRAYRMGQRRNVLVQKLVCRGTVEERVDELIASKRALATQVIESGGELLLTELGSEQLLELVALDRRVALDEG